MKRSTAKLEASKHGYPVMLKPANNSGSRKVIICSKKNAQWSSQLGTPDKVISKFKGINRLQNRKDVINIIPTLNVGDLIRADGTTAQILATIWIDAKMMKMRWK